MWSRLLFLTLAGLVQSSLSSAPIYIFDRSPQADRTEAPVISPDVAQLLFAQRLGISQHHVLGGLEQSAISYLNEDGSQTPLLMASQGDGRRAPSLLVFVEGVENAQANGQETLDMLAEMGLQPSFVMADPPTTSANERLARALSRQLVSREGALNGCLEDFESVGSYFGSVSGVSTAGARCCPTLLRYLEDPADHKSEPMQELESLLLEGLVAWCGNAAGSVMHVSALGHIAKNEGTSSATYKDALKSLSRILTSLRSLAETGEQKSVVVLFPPSTRNAKRLADPYGDSLLAARSANPERQASEVPLEGPESTPSLDSAISAKSRVSQTAEGASTPRHILPVCHSSLDSCMTATKNCSGHGSCNKKYSGHGANEEGGKDCYACRCTSTVLRDSDTRVKTIHWGGAACEKKDVSMPFFLLAGITILLMSAASWGIGLLYSVGAEPLPGVIGAGVAGVRAK